MPSDVGLLPMPRGSQVRSLTAGDNVTVSTSYLGTGNAMPAASDAFPGSGLLNDDVDGGAPSAGHGDPGVP